MKKRRLFRFFYRPRNAPKYDEYGRSQRRLCFEEFDGGKVWKEVAKEHGIKPTTCRRYYQTWKKMPKDFEQTYQEMVYLLKDQKTRSRVAGDISRKLGLTSEEIGEILLRPWGLKSLLLACCGLKKMEVKRSESEKAALIRMEKAIRKSGRSIMQVIQENEKSVALHDEIRKMARERMEGRRISRRD